MYNSAWHIEGSQQRWNELLNSKHKYLIRICLFLSFRLGRSTSARGCSFVGKIPRDMYEDELVPVFERAGKIYEFRLMMEFSGGKSRLCL